MTEPTVARGRRDIARQHGTEVHFLRCPHSGAELEAAQPWDCSLDDCPQIRVVILASKPNYVWRSMVRLADVLQKTIECYRQQSKLCST